MPGFKLAVTVQANDCDTVEELKLFCSVPFTEIHGFAVLAPSLQVIWVVAVFNETNGVSFRVEHMTADNRGDTTAPMSFARDPKRLLFRHSLWSNVTRQPRAFRASSVSVC